MTDKCQQVEARLEAYFSETMNLNERIDIEQHIANCSACQSELDGYSKIDALVETHFRWQVARATNRVSPPNSAAQIGWCNGSAYSCGCSNLGWYERYYFLA